MQYEKCTIFKYMLLYDWCKSSIRRNTDVLGSIPELGILVCEWIVFI